MMEPYAEFIARKGVDAAPAGLADIPSLNPAMRPDQRDVTAYLLGVGRGAAFLDTGLGKTFVELEWARVVAEATDRRVLILAPLAVGPQTAREAQRFGIDAAYVREPGQSTAPVLITNYERVGAFDPRTLGGIALDESSILKSFTGATTRALIEAFRETPFRLAATATPAPNDHMELGQHSAFLGIMPSSEMLTRWFISDQALMGRYRLKGHAVRPFWSWVASWARCASRPSDLGHPDDGFDLPPLTVEKHVVRADVSVETGEFLFRIPETSATSIHREKRLTLSARAELIADLVNGDSGESWIVWCDLDEEEAALTSRIKGAIAVRGSMPADVKERRLLGFADGTHRVLVTKPSIAGFGLNWQHCARMAFVGLSFSYESYYQAVRRCWRFGQARPVKVHIAMADTERVIWDTIDRKAGDHDRMKAEMVAAMKRAAGAATLRVAYRPTVPMALPTWLGANDLARAA